MTCLPLLSSFRVALPSLPPAQRALPGLSAADTSRPAWRSASKRRRRANAARLYLTAMSSLQTSRTRRYDVTASKPHKSHLHLRPEPNINVWTVPVRVFVSVTLWMWCSLFKQSNTPVVYHARQNTHASHTSSWVDSQRRVRICLSSLPASNASTQFYKIWFAHQCIPVSVMFCFFCLYVVSGVYYRHQSTCDATRFCFCVDVRAVC